MTHVATVMELARAGADSATALSVLGGVPLSEQQLRAAAVETITARDGHGAAAVLREPPPGAAAPADIVLVLHTSATVRADHLSVPQCDIKLLNKVIFRPEIPRGGTGKLLQRSAWPLSSASHRRSG